MRKQKTPNAVATPWHVPVAADDIPDAGRHFDISADAAVRAEVACVAVLRDLPRFEAHFDVARRGDGGLHVTGLVSATVGQNCVVTLDPLVDEISEKVDLVFLPGEAAARPPGKNDKDDDGETEPRDVKWDDPEPLVGGGVDLGAIAIEFLILGLDPYPHKPGAVFDPPAEPAAEESPFAALAKLKG
jgi:uncharacterized protein DUF177 involved in 23S rRNA accumulation